MRNRVLPVLLLASLIAGGVRAAALDAYRDAARKYAEALLRYGRDHYGPAHTPLFVQILDLRTLEIPRQRTAEEWRTETSTWKEDPNYQMWGKDRSSVLWAQDSNLLWDTENVRLFQDLTRDTGDARFAAAADEYMRYFLKHCVSPTTGLFAWGEHIAYNVQDDEIHGQRHELQHPAPLWDELWSLDPDAVRNEIEGVYRYHITDRRSMAYDRHANYWNGLPERDQATILGYVATYIDAFAFLYQKTQNPKYEEWARKLVLAFQSKSDAAGLYPDNWTEQQARELPYAFVPRPNVASGLYTAYERTHDAAWLDDANRYMDACDAAFRSSALKEPDRVSGEPGFVEAALLGYRLTGREKYLRMATRVGDDIVRREQPHAQMASMLADKLNAIRRLYEATADPHWLEGAEKLGDFALRAFVHASGLIRGTAIVNRPDYYDAIQGPGALALALYRLGSLKIPAAGMKPVQPSGDTEPPSITGLQFPKLADNASPVPVTVHIRDASGIKRAGLLYTYGNEIGFADSSPQISGDTYTFHIRPPGLAFLGEAFFAVEAVDASPNGNRALSGWNRLRMAAYERQNAEKGTLRFTDLGLTVSSAATLQPVQAAVQARAMRALPDGAQPPPKGWVSTGRYVCFDEAPKQAGRLSLSYTPEDTWRLIESTLTLAYWNGSEWQHVPSQTDSRSHLVDANYYPANCWTLLGEDRVLWRAPGRQGGVSLADLNGDGRQEVATVYWQPGQLLRPDGTEAANFPIDPPYHPLQNPSTPIVARLRPGQPPVILFGAPAGYVYAYDRGAKLLWRTEVGGEILGGVAVGKLTGGPDLCVVAAWDGGVQAIDAEGRTMWRKQTPTPSGSIPVLVDLDGDGKLDILLNAGSEVLALKGESGAPLWSFSIPGAKFATPAAGAFVPGGKPRVVTGDDSGIVYALTESGKLLWRQERIYGPREVPEQIDQYAPISEIALADLERRGERQVIVTTKSGDTVALTARGERLWHFASYERRVGTSLARGGRLAFADLDNDGRLETIVAQQDSYLYVLDSSGRVKWMYRGYFWYHNSPAVADLQHTGELDIVFTAPEEGGTYALRSGFRGPAGRAPWPMDRGAPDRANCAPW